MRRFFSGNIYSNCEILEYWNTQKSVWRISHNFSCLVDEGIPKIWKKLNFYGGFFRADYSRAKMCCQMGSIGCAILQVAQRAIVRIQFLSYVWNTLESLSAASFRVNKWIYHSINTTWSQILIIDQILKALDFLLKKSVLTIVVFYTQKKTQEGQAFIGSTNPFPWSHLQVDCYYSLPAIRII